MKHMTAEDFIDKAMAFADNTDCAKCPIINQNLPCHSDYQGCQTLFLASLLAGTIDLDGKPVAVSKTETTTPPTCSKTEQVPAAPALPKWCKVGQWIFDNVDTLCKIVEVLPYDIRVQYSHTKLEHRLFVPGNLRPVRFRPYTFEETKALAGKTIVYDEEENNGDDEQQAWETVSEVHEGLDGILRINHMPFSVWKSRHATIDGVPFGVPEVDTDAEKEEQQ